MSKKVIIILIAFFLMISIGTISIIGFYYAKDSERTPIFALKSENVAKQYIKYSSLLYDVYECYSGKIYASSKKKEPVCNRIITYKDGYYTNINGLKIAKKDYQTIYDISHKFDEVENFKTSRDVEDAVLVSTEYQRNLSKILKSVKIKKEIVNIRAFKDLVSNEYDDYSWVYMTEDESYYKCEMNGLYKEYKNGNCIGEWTALTYSEKWCELAHKSFNLNIREVYNKFCK